MNKPSAILITFLAILIFSTNLWWNELAYIIRTVGSGDINAVAQMIRGAGTSAIILSIAVNVAISLSGVIPSVFLTGANLLVFGLYAGFLISWSGEVAGAAVSFLLYRWGVKSAVKLPTNQWKLTKIVNALPVTKQVHFLAVLRMAPFIPSGMINLLGAITTVSLTTFLIATAVGKLPALMLEAAFSYNLVTVSKNYVYLGISVILAVLFYCIVKKELDRLGK